MLYATALVTFGLLAVRVGSYIGKLTARTSYDSSGNTSLFTARLENSWLSSLFLIAALVALVFLVRFLGIEFFTSSRMSKVGQVESLAELGLLLTLPRALAFGTLLYSVALTVGKWHQKRSIDFVGTLILVSAIGVNAVVNFPLSLSRFWLFGFLISLVWIVSPPRTAVFRSVFVVIMTLMQFTFFPWYSQFTRDSGLFGFDLDSIRRYVRYGDFDGFQTIINVTMYIEEAGFELGRNLTSVVLFFVPRAIWEQKADPLGIASSEFMGYSFTNLSAPIYGEFYADFGLFSLLLGMGAVGFGICRFDRIYDFDLRSNRFGVGFLITSILAGYLIIILRGSLLGVLPGITTLLGVVILAAWLGYTRILPTNKIRQPLGENNWR